MFNISATISLVLCLHLLFVTLFFFKRRTPQLLKAMFTIHDLHWLAAVLNPRTRMLKLATDLERSHADDLIRSELANMIELDRELIIIYRTNVQQLVAAYLHLASDSSLILHNSRMIPITVN